MTVDGELSGYRYVSGDTADSVTIPEEWPRRSMVSAAELWAVVLANGHRREAGATVH